MKANRRSTPRHAGAGRDVASRQKAGRAQRRKKTPRATAGARFQELVDIMRALRSPDGCPWDREQTLESLRAFLLEETYETLEAIDRADYDALRGEIGDLLFEGVFLARIAEDDKHFTVADALESIVAKLLRRHPHVFGARARPGQWKAQAARLKTSGQVLEQWEQIKAGEQRDAGETRRVLGGVSSSLPALLRAYQIGNRVAAVGFEWPDAPAVMEKVEEELAELRQALEHEDAARAAEEMGDLLFAIANLSRKLGVEPESALRKANEKFTRRFDALEQRLHARGHSVHDATLEEMEAEWTAIKAEAGTGP